MKTIAVASVFLWGACLISFAQSGEKSVTWDDPAGDVQPSRGAPTRPVLDIVNLRAEGRDGFIHLTAKIKGNFKDFFDWADAKSNKWGGVLVEYYLDTDNNKQTGGSPMWAEKATRPLGGYEFKAGVALGYRFKEKKSGQESAAGGKIGLDTTKHEILGPSVTYTLGKLKPEGAADPIRRDPKDPTKTFAQLSTMGTDSVEIRIPYSLLGIKEGDIVRICFDEVGQGPNSAEGFSEDKQLTVAK